MFGANEQFYVYTQNYFLSGFISGAVTALIINPFELYKIKNQVLSNTNNNIYKGLLGTMSRESIATGIYFSSYFIFVFA